MISAKNLRVIYGRSVIYENANVEIPAPGINFLMGKNGAGKTTLIKCLLSFMKYSGKLTIDGKEYKNDKHEVFSIFDDSALYKNLTGLQNIMLITGVDKDIIYKNSVDFLSKGLLHKKVKTYSYGERKKVFLIVVSILRPKLLIMDEVSNGLDYETMLILKEKIKLWARSSTILLTGHQFEFYRDIVDRVFVVAKQKIHRIEELSHLTLEEIYEETVE